MLDLQCVTDRQPTWRNFGNGSVQREGFSNQRRPRGLTLDMRCPPGVAGQTGLRLILISTSGMRTHSGLLFSERAVRTDQQSKPREKKVPGRVVGDVHLASVESGL